MVIFFRVQVTSTITLKTNHQHNKYHLYCPKRHLHLANPASMAVIRYRKRRNTVVSSLSSSSPSPEDKDEEELVVDRERKGPEVKTLLRRFWKVAAPYWVSDDKVEARLRLGGVFALTLATTGISVAFSFLGRDFYNALANKDQEQFTKQLLYYLAGFAGGIPFFVLRDYAKETLSLRWRSWMTAFYMEHYLKNQTFYRIQSQSIIDNPDQRIVDDLSSFTGTALAFSLTLFNAAVDLVSFSNILYGIYPPLFVVLVVYSIGGTAISVLLGKGLVPLNFLQEKKEADFRYGLVRVRENAESIAFYGGEENEMQLLLQRFTSAFENLSKLLISSRNLEFFTSGYRYLIQILPAAVVAPMYFSGKIEFGVINQSASAFNHILGDFSLIVYQFQAISAFSAVIDRLGEFDDVLDSSNSKSLPDACEDISLFYLRAKTSNESEFNGSVPVDQCQQLLDIQNLTLQTPNRTTLIRDLSLLINERDNLLVMGPSGSGKTSLLRAMAGLWSCGSGKIKFYVNDADDPSPQASSTLAVEVNGSLNGEQKPEGPIRNSRSLFFLPQRPYMVLGTLRQQLLYPTWLEDVIPSTDMRQQSGCNLQHVHIIVVAFSHLICGELSTSLDDDIVNLTAGSVPFLTPKSNSEYDSRRASKPTTDDLVQALEDVRLGYILPRLGNLDSMHEWSSVLSLGEQQRLAFARLLLSKPKLALMDEATSALDEVNEAHLYQKIEAAGITYISVGHRRTLQKHHNMMLCIASLDPRSNDRNWYIEPINTGLSYNISTT